MPLLLLFLFEPCHAARHDKNEATRDAFPIVLIVDRHRFRCRVLGRYMNVWFGVWCGFVGYGDVANFLIV